MVNDSYFRFDEVHILTIMTGESGKLKTHSPIYWMKDNCENSLNLRHTLGSIYHVSMLFDYHATRHTSHNIQGRYDDLRISLYIVIMQSGSRVKNTCVIRMTHTVDHVNINKPIYCRRHCKPVWKYRRTNNVSMRFMRTRFYLNLILKKWNGSLKLWNTVVSLWLEYDCTLQLRQVCSFMSRKSINFTLLPYRLITVAKECPNTLNREKTGAVLHTIFSS